MIAAGTIGGSADPNVIEEMDRELDNIIDDFDRAVYVEALHLANVISKPHILNLLIIDPQGYGVERAGRVEQERVELRRLQPVETSYHRGLGS